MKTLCLPLLALAFAAALPLQAETASSTPAVDSKPDRPRLRAHGERRAADRARLAERLGLTAEQQAQLKAKRAATAATVKAIRADTALTPEQKRAKLRETFQASQAEMRALLTPEQQTKFVNLRKHARRIAHRRTSL